MPLARIITRSHECSRELALDLLSRGYTVEIVAPDRVPDHIADLELRVDAVPGELVATVEAHNGDRTASLDFVHHLKAPMADFIRRPVGGANGGRVPGQYESAFEVTDTGVPTDSDAAKVICPPVNIVRDSEPVVSQAVSLVVAPVLPPAVDSRSVLPEAPPLISPIAAPTTPTVAPISSLPTATPTASPSLSKTAPVVRLPHKASSPLQSQAARKSGVAQMIQSPPSRSTSWLPGHRDASLVRASLTLVGIVLLALSMWMGARQGKASAKTLATTPQSPATDSAAASLKHAASDVPREAGAAVSSNGPKNQPPSIPVRSARNSKPHIRVKTSHDRAPEYIAPNTVVYFDKHTADEAAARKAAQRLSVSSVATSNPGGVIAASSVTYLNNKPPQKTKQVSSTKSTSTPD